MRIQVPYFYSDSKMLNRAARIAVGDIAGNCMPYQAGLLQEEATCIMAGLDYDMPWTRDASINVMNALCLMDPETAKNTLLSVCEQREGRYYIIGQYWDRIIWAVGAWQYYLVSGDRDFLTLSADAIANSLEEMEQAEQDGATGLFRGAAVYGDGVAAYPDRYARTIDHNSGILDWPQVNPAARAKQGYGLPMKALSTNCVYYAAYRIEEAMCRLLARDGSVYGQKAQALGQAINRRFWNEKTGRYDYLLDEEGGCDAAEALGLSFAMLFGLADEQKADSIAAHTYVSQQGIPCVWPSFDRYRIGDNYGRHSGTVWPHAQGFWGMAMLRSGHQKAFEKELFTMAHRALTDAQFAEIYHPVSGTIYGGMQEDGENGLRVWKSCEKQTWSATGFWSLIYYGIFGLQFGEESVTVRPCLPTSIDHAELKNLPYGDMMLTLIVDRGGNGPSSAVISREQKGRKIIRLSVDG